MNTQPSPIQEAINYIIIASILITISVYFLVASNTDLATPAVLWIADQVYHWVPGLEQIKLPAILIGSLSVGAVFCLVGIAFAAVIAKALGTNQIADLERQTYRLKRNRERYKNRRRNKDRFEVS